MTTIRVLLATRDREYRHRVADYFEKHHPEVKFTLRDNPEEIPDMVSSKTYNIILIGEEFSEAAFVSTPYVACACLSASSSGKGENESIETIFKYKSGEEIYKILLGMYADVSANRGASAVSSRKIYGVVSANGGAGATTVAAALCIRLSRMGKSVLYFSCDKYSYTSPVFQDNVQTGDLSDLIYAIKSAEGKNVNLSAKTSSLLKKDIQSNVEYFSGCKYPYDYDGLTPELLRKLVDVAVGAKSFDCVVFDGSIYDERYTDLIKEKADSILLVSENTPSAVLKLKKVIDQLEVMNRRGDADIMSKFTLILNNKNVDQGNTEVPDGRIELLGMLPKHRDASFRAISEAISRRDELWSGFLAQ